MRDADTPIPSWGGAGGGVFCGSRDAGCKTPEAIAFLAGIFILCVVLRQFSLVLPGRENRFIPEIH